MGPIHCESERFSKDVKHARERLPNWENKICKVWSRKRLEFLRKWEKKMATRWTVRDNVPASGKPQDRRRDTWCLQTRGRKYKTGDAAFTRRERREGSRKGRRTRKRRKTKNREQNNGAETVITRGQWH